MTVYYDLRTVMFCIIAIGIFILSTAGTVIMSKGIRRKSEFVILFILLDTGRFTHSTAFTII